MVDALLKKATFHYLTGKKKEALEAYNKVSEGKTMSTGQLIDITLKKIMLGFFWTDHELIKENLYEAEKLMEQGSSMFFVFFLLLLVLNCCGFVEFRGRLGEEEPIKGLPRVVCYHVARLQDGKRELLGWCRYLHLYRTLLLQHLHLLYYRHEHRHARKS